MSFWERYSIDLFASPFPPNLKTKQHSSPISGSAPRNSRKSGTIEGGCIAISRLPRDQIRSAVISAPDERLKFLQRKLADKIAQLYRPRNPVHGFVADRSIKTNALAHMRRRFVVNVDLKDFFPTISQNRVEGMLLSLGIDARVAEILARICCNNRHLPQGAPSSPVLSNMICFRLDKELMSIAKDARCIYTRYADDITLSSHQPPTALFEAPLPQAGCFSPTFGAQSPRRHPTEWLRHQPGQNPLCRPPLTAHRHRPQDQRTAQC